MSETQLRLLVQYRSQILTAWQRYRAEIAKGTEQTSAELVSVRSVFPENEDIAEILALWRQHRLWPLFNPTDSEFDTDPNDSVELTEDIDF